MSRSFIVLSLTLPPITPSMYFSRHGLSWLHSDLPTAASSELEPTITDLALQKKELDNTFPNDFGMVRN